MSLGNDTRGLGFRLGVTWPRSGRATFKGTLPTMCDSPASNEPCIISVGSQDGADTGFLISSILFSIALPSLE